MEVNNRMAKEDIGKEPGGMDEKESKHEGMASHKKHHGMGKKGAKHEHMGKHHKKEAKK